MFVLTVLSIWALMHAYVFWRLYTIPGIGRRVPGWVVLSSAVLFWASFPMARMATSRVSEGVALAIEYVAMTWVGVLFLLFAFLLIADLITLGGRLFPSIAPRVRATAVVAALVAAIFSLVQGARDPAVHEYEVSLPDLPASADGYTLVAVSDLHLGSILRKSWLTGVIEQIHALEPRAVVIAGDLIDGDVEQVSGMVPTLRRLTAPDGVWAVVGNHEFYAGLSRSVDLIEDAGIEVLHDRSAELTPGLVLAGVIDPAVPVGEGRPSRIAAALGDVPADTATILLSHTPENVQEAAAAGADLMLSGHTHGGQIWPFNLAVRLRFPYVYGHHRIDGMQLIVSRGAGTWGPRMRLWSRGEILRIRLRAGEASEK